MKTSEFDSVEPTLQQTRRQLIGGSFAAVALVGASALAQTRTDIGPRTLNDQPVPEPSAERSAGPVAPGRGSSLQGKTALVTGAARGIGRAIAVELAANGADVVAIDIAGPVSHASDAKPATLQDLQETVGQIQAYGWRGESRRADIRDIKMLRKLANEIDRGFGKIDIVVADAAIQRWKPLLEMEDAECGMAETLSDPWP